jgi:hypothetical protein
MFNKVWVLRDWLAAYNASLGKAADAMPETLDEFEAMLLYFKDNDMNGNGDPSDEIPLMGKQCFAHLTMPGDERGRLAKTRTSEPRVAKRGWIEGLGTRERSTRIPRVAASRQSIAGDCAVERAGVEIGKPVMRGDALADRAFA